MEKTCGDGEEDIALLEIELAFTSVLAVLQGDGWDAAAGAISLRPCCSLAPPRPITAFLVMDDGKMAVDLHGFLLHGNPSKEALCGDHAGLNSGRQASLTTCYMSPLWLEP